VIKADKLAAAIAAGIVAGLLFGVVMLAFIANAQRETISQLTERVVKQEETLAGLHGFLKDIARHQGQQAVDIGRHAEILSNVAQQATETATATQKLDATVKRNYTHFLTGKFPK
jgi:predicted PurR-regulated permease PerM